MRGWLPALVASCACGSGPAPATSPRGLVFDGPPPRNLLFLSIDTLRADAVGPDDAPFLAGLADEAT